MEALAEQLVATYLTRGGKVFIVPQYPVLGDGPDTEWSCPDFVALSYENPQRPEILVVEVTTGSDSRRTFKNVMNRRARWFDQITAKLKGDEIINSTWPIRFLGFVRRSNLERLQREFTGVSDVHFIAIEDVSFSWDYWEKRKMGLFS